MKLDDRIKKMLENYPEQVPLLDKIREILQQTALMGLARHQFFEHAVFFGGTALRILYGLDRYSEDLDFSLVQKKPDFDFSPFIKGMHQEIQAMGFDMEYEVRQKNEDTGVWSAFLKGNTITLLLSIQETKGVIKNINPEQKIQIKLEIETDPPQSHLPFETKLVKSPVPFYVSTYALVDLFASKMHAALFRKYQKWVKGRDWYDIVWYIQNGTSLNLGHLRDRMLQLGHLQKGEPFGEKELRQQLHDKIESIDWESAKKDVARFIPDDQRLKIWSAPFFHDLVATLRCVDHGK